MKILFVTTDWNTPYRIATGEYGGVSYYRAYGPAKALKKLGHEVDVMGYHLSVMIDKNNPFKSYKKIFSEYDAVVFKQIDTENGGRVLGACKEVGVPVIMDLDDLITELDPDNPAVEQGYEQGGKKQALAIASLSMCDALFVSTQPLADEYTKVLKEVYDLDTPVFVLPNCCDYDLWKRQKREKDEWTIIGWHGSITHDKDIALVIPPIKRLLLKYPKLVFSLTGGIRQETYDNLIVKGFGKKVIDRVVINTGTQSYNKFPEYLSRHQWDFAIAPLKDTKFTRGKSHIKWLENSLLRVATIASDTYPYSQPIHGVETIIDGKTGLLARNEKEWEEKIELLINDERKRYYLARDAHRFVLENWQYDNFIHLWEDALQSVITRGSNTTL